MRSMSKLALLVGAGLPLMLLASSAMAQNPAPTPAPAAATPPPPAAAPAPAAATPAPAAATPAPPAVTPAPAAQPTTVVVAVPPTPVTSTAIIPDKPAVGADGRVEIHIATKELVTLEHRSGPGAPWVTACQTPCDERLPAGDEYRVIGEGLNDSNVFALTSPRGDTVKIHVAPGFKKKERIGKIMTITGGVVFVGAAVIGLVAANPGNDFNASGTTNNYNWDVIIVGTTIAVAGLATAIVGGSYWYNNAETRVAGDIQGEQPVLGGIEPRYQTGMRMGAPTAPVYSTSLFSTTF
jgi:hypothetical protein